MALTPSLNPYGTNNIATGLIVQAPHVYQFVYALAGTEAYNILISGSLSVTGSTQLSGSLKLLGLSPSSQSKILSIDSTTGNVYLMDTSSVFPLGMLSGSGVDKYISIWKGTNYVTASKVIYEDNNKIGIGTTSLSSTKLTISGGLTATGSNILSGGLKLEGLDAGALTYILGLDNNQNVYYTSSVASLLPFGNDWDIQLKSGSALSTAKLGSGSYHFNIGAWTLGIRGTGTIGSWSFATGTGSVASNKYSFAKGLETLASGEASTAEGWKTQAIGPYSHAQGTSTTASGENSHAAGSNTSASGANSNANGYYTIAAGDNQTVIGKYNKTGNTTDLFIIGSGSGNTTRFDLANFGTTIKLNASTFITGSSFSVSSSVTNISGNIYFPSLITANETRFLVVDGNGKLYYTSSTGGGGGGSAISVWNGNTNSSLTTNLTTLYITGSGVTATSPSAGIISMSISGGAGSSPAFPFNGNAIITGSLLISGSGLTITGSTVSTGGFTGSLFGTASYVTGSIFTNTNPALTASYAVTASYALNTTAGGVNTTIQFNRLGTITGSNNFTFITSSNTILLTGSLKINSGSVSASFTYLSASGTDPINVLQVYGSGSSSPLFSVNGSQGQLFTVTDLLSGSLFSVRDISGIPILNVYSDNTVLMGNFSYPSLHTTAYGTVNTGRTTMYTFSTSSYIGAIVEYYATSASVAFAGSVNAVWIPGKNLLSYTSSSIVTIGSPVGFGFLVSASLSGSGVALIQASASSDSWSTRMIIRSI